MKNGKRFLTCFLLVTAPVLTAERAGADWTADDYGTASIVAGAAGIGLGVLAIVQFNKASGLDKQNGQATTESVATGGWGLVELAGAVGCGVACYLLHRTSQAMKEHAFLRLEDHRLALGIPGLAVRPGAGLSCEVFQAVF